MIGDLLILSCYAVLFVSLCCLLEHEVAIKSGVSFSWLVFDCVAFLKCVLVFLD